MIDTHIHMVPGVDDGAEDMTMALAMARQAIKEGVSEMILTPHYNVPVFDSDEIDEQFMALEEALAHEGIALKIHLGNEIHVNEESVKGLSNGRARTMADSQYVLMELPFHHYYPFHETLLFDLQVKGYQILLAHVERYRIFRRDENKLRSMIAKGFFAQLSTRTIVEHKSRARALRWIEAGYIHIIASDSHNTGRRPSMMSEAYEVICSHFDESTATLLFTENPRRVIENQPLVSVEGRRKKGLFKRMINRVMQ